MLRNLALLCFCLSLLGLAGCGLGRKVYKVEKDENETFNVVIGNPGEIFRIRIPPPKTGTGVTGSVAGTEERNGVKASYEVKYLFKTANELIIQSVKFNGEEIPSAEPPKEK